MRSVTEILDALERLARMRTQPRKNESHLSFYARLHFVDGLRRAASELANWIVGDDSDEIADELQKLETEETSDPVKLNSNGRVYIRKVQIEPDIVDQLRERGIKLSDGINNALALYYLKQRRQSKRASRGKPMSEKQIRHGRHVSRVSIDEDLIEYLDEEAQSAAERYDVQPYRTSLLNAALRLYLWTEELADSQPTGGGDGSADGVPIGTSAA